MIDVVVSGVLFDMDGTLVDSTAVVEAAWTRFGDEHGLDPVEILGFSHGRQTIDTIQRFLPDLPRDEQQVIVDTMIAAEIDYVHGIIEVPGAGAFVRRLQDLGVPVALVTSAPRELAVKRMIAAGVPVPDALVPSEDAERSKPHPEGYLRGAELLGVPADRCLAFEDAPAGVEAALASGAATVVVGTLEADVTAGLPRIAGYDGLTVEPEGSGFRIRG